ncbi:MAG TPA: DUF5671 domain-containing protein [Candidatus Saccharimonadales bacterium]|nr:DUF5671 domain-containing protein [Candidatus Saccharimonadales bacterium]
MMPNELDDFVKRAKEKGLADGVIEQKLIDAGWSRERAQAALIGDSDLVVPKPPLDQGMSPSIGAHSEPNKRYDENNPVHVIQNLSTRGFEYSIMFVSLWASAIGLAGLLNSLAGSYLGSNSSDGYASGGLDAFWITVLVVFAPIFAFMLLRLKKAELLNPALLKDPSRKRLSHITQFATFITGAIYLIYFVYSLMSGDIGTEGGMTVSELIAHLIITFAVVGAIFFYYWREEHRGEIAKLPHSDAAL